jgi:imidazolonepropionase
MPRTLLRNAILATMQPERGPYGLVASGAVVIEDSSVVWCGAGGEIPAELGRIEATDLGGRLVTPALIDCHTHLVYSGNRAREFELRLQGASYEQIAREGGGIVSTVSATRAASERELLAMSLPRVDALLAEAVSTIEIKSGYGLTIEDELKILRVARRISDIRPVRVVTSYLAAHALPPEFKDRADRYLDDVVLPGMEIGQREGLIDAVDGFCERIAFSLQQIERVFAKAKALGLPVKLHAEQLSNLNGAALVARYGGLSADHLEYLDSDGVAAMSAAKTVAVLLPGAFYTLREKQMPPVEQFRASGVPIAVATDSNPGTSPMTSLLLAMNMAATLFRLTPEETLIGTTRNAARALGLRDTGVIAPGYRADLAVWDVAHPAELSYRIGFNPLHQHIFAGAFQ